MHIYPDGEIYQTSSATDPRYLHRQGPAILRVAILTGFGTEQVNSTKGRSKKKKRDSSWFPVLETTHASWGIVSSLQLFIFFPFKAD